MADLLTEKQTIQVPDSIQEMPDFLVHIEKPTEVIKKAKPKYSMIAGDAFLLFVQISILVMIIVNFIGRVSIVQGSSMFPSLQNDNRVLINLITYHFKEPERGDIIVFRCPVSQKRDYIKRVIALPGEKVQIIKGNVYINGELLQEDYLRDVRSHENCMKITVPSESVFVMGDNRINSEDSRYWGPVDYKLIKGKANLVFWPPGSFHMLK
jgi:signal peptidase I